MELIPPQAAIRFKDTHRLVPSRYPSAGILDAVASPEDLELMFELESWTKDRISAELGILTIIPRSEWVTGRRMASVIMAAFCHPRPEGSRFNGPDRGAWYAARSLATAHAETIYHRTAELAEIGVFETRVEMRLYLADFKGLFHDIRAPQPEYEPFHDPASYRASQALGRDLLAEGSNGIVYRSVRHPGGECLACFRPALVRNVRAAGHFEYRWTGGPEPRIRALPR
ncbi:MAG: RES family NAD+ phosphorylase [Bryobacteraceae bacterium]|nr:RES family NAD+ phosphorylase [Bryobacteraceae bacterium]